DLSARQSRAGHGRGGNLPAAAAGGGGGVAGGGGGGGGNGLFRHRHDRHLSLFRLSFHPGAPFPLPCEPSPFLRPLQSDRSSPPSLALGTVFLLPPIPTGRSGGKESRPGTGARAAEAVARGWGNRCAAGGSVMSRFSLGAGWFLLVLGC